MKLSKEQTKQVQEAILSGYDEPGLRMMVRVELGEDLTTIAGGDSLPLRVRVFNLIGWAERNDRIFDLIDGTKAQQENNTDIQRMWQASQQWRQPASAVPAGKPPIEFDWVTVRAGYFWMGNREPWCGERKDRIYVPAFKIARVPVTNTQYEQFIDATGYAPPEYWKHGRIPQGKDTHPIDNISWRTAVIFCRWANVRLPTEAEWEKAARGTDGRRYPWGHERPQEGSDLCNFGRYLGGTAPVDQYPKGTSPYGVLDMVGNVSEWTSSLYWPYPYNANDGRELLVSDGGEFLGGEEKRVLRGGSWFTGGDFVTVSIRFEEDPDSDGGGFRVVAVETP